MLEDGLIAERATVAIVLAAAGLAAAVGPVRRSAAVDPLSILRAE